MDDLVLHLDLDFLWLIIWYWVRKNAAEKNWDSPWVPSICSSKKFFISLFVLLFWILCWWIIVIVWFCELVSWRRIEGIVHRNFLLSSADFFQLFSTPFFSLVCCQCGGFNLNSVKKNSESLLHGPDENRVRLLFA